LGLWVGNASRSDGEERGAAAGMLVVAMYFGVLLGRKGTAWFTVQDGPTWAQYMVRAVCAAPLLAIGCAPIFDLGGGMAVWLGLIATATFTNWEKLVDGRTDGEISFGQVFSKWIGALVLTSIAAGLTGYHRPDRVMFISAGVAAVVAFVMQAAAAWIPYRRRESRAAASDAAQAGRGSSPTQPVSPMAACCPPPPSVPWAAPAAQPSVRDSGQAALPAAPARWALTRAFWGLVAFGLMGGAIVTFLVPLIATDMDHHDVTLAVILCTGFAAFMIFALCKIGPVKRVGFWRETLRPFLISASLFGIGGTITGISREWDHYSVPCEIDLSVDTPGDADIGVDIGELVKVQARVREAQKRIAAHVGPFRLGIEGQESQIRRRCVTDEGRVALVSGLVFSSLLFLSLMLSFLTGGSPRSAQPFLQDGESGSVGVGSAAPPSGLRPHRGGTVLVPLTVAAIVVLFLAMFLLLTSR